MRIYLVRHGQSEANVDKRVHLTTADHAIPLSWTGRDQAEAAAAFLHDHFATRRQSWGKIRLWHSPYLRARETAEAFKIKFNGMLDSTREHLLLCEQQFGLFDGISHEGTKSEIERRFPAEYEHYKKCEKFEGGFWARMPLGESKFDLCLRVHQSFGTFHRDVTSSGIQDVIVVAHGSTNRAFAMMWLHRPYEWFEKEPNPPNCSIRLIENNEDKGYIFKP